MPEAVADDRHVGAPERRVVIPLEATEGIVLSVGGAADLDEQVHGSIVADSSDPAAVADQLRAVTDASTRLMRIGARLQMGLEQVLQALEDVADAVPVGAGDAAAHLSEHDQAALREAGLLRQPHPGGAIRSPALASIRYAQLLAKGLTVKEASARLGVSEGRIRQRLADRSLYGFQTKQGWRLAGFQFTESGSLPGLELVLRALPDKWHPLSVEGFFTRPNVDTDEGYVSVAEWLASGGDPDEAVELARDVLVTA